MRVLLIAVFTLAAIGPAAAADLKLLTAGAFKSMALELAPERAAKVEYWVVR